jgi:hypothetical protein
MSPLRRRVVVVAASTLAVGVLSAVAPTRAIEAASAATPTTAAPAGQAAATGTATAVKATVKAPVTTPTRRAAPRVVVRVKTAAVAPFRVGTVGFSQWWAKKLMVKRYGWTSAAQFRCLVTLWNHESHWNYRSHNKSSGAHGIPQALPGSKMAKVGSDWLTNPVTQIRWGLGYIKGRYGSPCGAWSHFQSHSWY